MFTDRGIAKRIEEGSRGKLEATEVLNMLGVDAGGASRTNFKMMKQKLARANRKAKRANRIRRAEGNRLYVVVSILMGTARYGIKTIGMPTKVLKHVRRTLRERSEERV